MNREITVTYTPQIVSSSVRLQWWNLIGISGISLLTLLIVVFVYLLITSERSWWFGFSLAALVMWGGMVILAYFRLLKFSQSRFRKMETPTAVFEFTDDCVSIAADTGKTEFAWRLLTKVIQSETVWVLVTAGGGVSLPTQALDAELKSFILSKLSTRSR